MEAWKSRIVAAGLVALLGSVPSCKCERDKPYVPYSIDGRDAATAWADAAPLVPETASGPGADGGVALTFVTAPPSARSFVVDGVTLEAPVGQTFVGAATFDFDGDGAKDAAAVLRSDGASQGPIFAVALFRASPNAGAKPAAALVPNVVASSPPLAKCDARAPVAAGADTPVKLALRGKSSLVVEVGASCPNRVPARWLVVVATEAKAPRARFAAGIADPPGAQPLLVDVEAADRDGDGIDDVALRIALDGAVAPFEPAPRVGASLVWLDRSAGLSRDPDEPEASFRAVSGALVARAARGKEAALVPVSVRQLRHLAHAACAEGGSARIVQLAGASLPSCAGSRALEEAGLAEARAQATLGDALRAALAFDRAQRPPAAKSPAKLKEVQSLLEKLAPVRETTSVRLLAAVPDEPPRDVPAFGPLAFEADGHLLIRTRAGVVRADVVQGDESDAGKPPWPSAIGGDGRPVLAAAVHACDGVAIRAVFTKPEGAATEVILPVVPPLGERCVVPRGEPQPVRPLAWGPSGLELIVGGEPLLVTEAGRAGLLAATLDAPGLPGAAKSPDGTALVVPTSVGLLVRGSFGARLLRAKELDGELRHCAVSNDGKRVACLQKKRVVAGVWDL